LIQSAKKREHPTNAAHYLPLHFNYCAAEDEDEDDDDDGGVFCHASDTSLLMLFA